MDVNWDSDIAMVVTMLTTDLLAFLRWSEIVIMWLCKLQNFSLQRSETSDVWGHLRTIIKMADSAWEFDTQKQKWFFGECITIQDHWWLKKLMGIFQDNIDVNTGLLKQHLLCENMKNKLFIRNHPFYSILDCYDE